jgi:YVTN family beta-propeller protein
MIRHSIVSSRSAFAAAASVLLVIAAGVEISAASFTAFESGHVRPLALSPSGDLLFAVNTPDNRLEVFRVTGAGLERAGDVFVGLEPVAVAARTDGEVYVVNHLSDSVSVVDASDPARPHVLATLLVGDEPRDVVIAGPARDKVFITAARRGQNRPGDPGLTTPGVGRADVWVFDAADLSATPHILTLFADTPRALAASPDGSRVYAAAFHSGNKTTVLEQLAVTTDATVNTVIGDGFTAPGAPPPLANTDGVPAPQTGLIVKHDGTRWRDSAGRDWTSRVRFHLPDRDLFIIDATVDPPAVIGDAAGIGTVLFNIAVHPVSGKLYVSNLESRNHVRFEPAVNGHIAESRITIVDGATVTPVHLNPHVNYSTPSGTPGEIAQSLAFPLGMAFSADGEKLYAAAFGSGKVAVLDADARVIGRIDAGGGPSGLALDGARGRLYVLNRFDQTISIVDVATEVETAVVPLRHDPEPPAVRNGRPLLYDARRSGHGDSACASCHIFGDFDSLAWDLGDPDGAVEENPIEAVPVQGGSLGDFHPMKGPMTTQSLRGMDGAGAMHWRGDRNGGSTAPFDEGAAFMAFRPAFQGLLGMAAPLPVEEMERFRDFILAVQYPPNPIAKLDGTLTAVEAAGKQVFDSNGSRSGVGGDGSPCASCHALPFGTDGHGSFEGLTQDFKVAHLRNLYQKIGMFGYAPPSIASDSPFRFESTPTPHMGDQVRGFGFLHDGSVPTLHNFFRFPLRQFTFPDQAGRTGDRKIRDLEAFLLAFPTGLAPCVGQQITLDTSNIDAPSFALDRYALLRARSDAGDCDLIVRGVAGGLERGFLHDGGGIFRSDRTDESLTEGQLADMVRGGAILTVTAVPPGSGLRMAIDRDEDGFLDGDEIAQGSDPADPSSIPGPATPFLRGDCAPSGTLDLSDAVASLDYIFRQTAAPSCIDACDANGDGVVDVSDGLFTLFFLFAGGRTPGLYPNCEPSTGTCAGGFACP